MGMYIFITELDRQRMREIIFDKELNIEFQEALKLHNGILINEYEKPLKNSFWRPSKFIRMYQVYHDVNPDESAYQARYQLSGSGNKQIVLAYLHGIINGANHALKS